MNVKEKAQLAVFTVKKKVLPVIASASVAMSTVAVNAFAVDDVGSSTSTSSMFQTIADSFKTGFSDLASGVALIIGGCIPVGVGIMGLYAAINAGKKILTKLAG